LDIPVNINYPYDITLQIAQIEVINGGIAACQAKPKHHATVIITPSNGIAIRTHLRHEQPTGPDKIGPHPAGGLASAQAGIIIFVLRVDRALNARQLAALLPAVGACAVVEQIPNGIVGQGYSVVKVPVVLFI